ncbi:testis-expressed protein 47-like isoform X2 [Montipora capricornis]|uniref:testis-expressed protein 47-like isoform X2 n=1 Tax=Montipora capricornis TaxID=246305 RepID=UPI0035F150F7
MPNDAKRCQTNAKPFTMETDEKVDEKIMAASPGAEEDSVFDTGRLSLFDLIIERTRAQNKKQLVHRLIYVSKIRHDVSDRKEIGGCKMPGRPMTEEQKRKKRERKRERQNVRYERLFKDLQAQVHGEAVTGLLLIYPLHIIHVIETSYSVLVKVIKDLEEDEQSISGMLLITRILVCTGDLNNRLFGQWNFKTLNLAVSRMQEFTTNEAIDIVISLANTMDHLPERVPDLLVRQDLMEYILSSQDLNTPSAYLMRYTTPMDIVLESELTWPMQTRLFPLS